jgi:hypothetical protein
VQRQPSEENSYGRVGRDQLRTDREWSADIFFGETGLERMHFKAQRIDNATRISDRQSLRHPKLGGLGGVAN